MSDENEENQNTPDAGGNDDTTPKGVEQTPRKKGGSPTSHDVVNSTAKRTISKLEERVGSLEAQLAEEKTKRESYEIQLSQTGKKPSTGRKSALEETNDFVKPLADSILGGAESENAGAEE